MTIRKVCVLIVLIALSILCAGCNDNSLDGVEDFLNNSDASKAVNSVVDEATDAVGDYVNEAATDAVEMTQKITEGNIPEVKPETSQAVREGVINTLDTVGQAVLEADREAKALQACFQQCDEEHADMNGGKTTANLVCVAGCKE